MKLKFTNLPEELLRGAELLGAFLGYELSDGGISVTVAKGDAIIARLEEGRGYIEYARQHHFYRALGLFLENAVSGADFSIRETPRFETVGLMLDASRNGVMTVESIKKYISYMAVMGYNLLMMYTEDTYEVKSRKYFGYMRGRYTHDELRECDRYAALFGIEMIPCIQTYGHMEQYLQWAEANDVKDTEKVILAGSEKTYEFIDEMIQSACAPYRSNRIHIGMDEAWDMGRGNYLTLNGWRDPFDIFCEHLGRVLKITDKYALRPMIWSDMFFRIASPTHSYYSEETIMPQWVKEKIPKNVDLVYWHYGEKDGCDGYMLDKHLDLERNIIFAGGQWSSYRHLPEAGYAMYAAEKALYECKRRGIKEVMTTLWFSDNMESNAFACLLGVQHTAEHCYNDAPDREHLKRRFEFCTRAKFEAFEDMSAYSNIFDDGREYENFNERFWGKQLFWQDIMEGLADEYLFRNPMSGHYKKYADKMRGYQGQGGQWGDMYEFCAALFDALHIKCFIAERLKKAYDAEDRAFLKDTADTYLPDLYQKLKVVQELHKKQWFSTLKVFGWNVLDIRYGGLRSRVKTSIERINSFLSGELCCLEELAAERLPFPSTAHLRYNRICSPYKQ